MVLSKVVSNAAHTDFESKWPSQTEMESSALLLEQNRTLGTLLHDVGDVCHVHHTQTSTFRTLTGRGSLKLNRPPISSFGVSTAIV